MIRFIFLLAFFLAFFVLVKLPFLKAQPAITSQPLPISPNSSLSPRQVEFSPDGRLLAVASPGVEKTRRKFLGFTFYAWSTKTGKFVASWPLFTLDQFAVSPQRKLVAVISTRQIYSERLRSGSYDVCTIQLRDFYSGKLKRTLIREGAIRANVYSLAWSRDGRLLATGSGDGLARVWDITTGKRLATLQAGGYVGELQFSPDGAWLATVGDNMTQGSRVALWDWRRKQQLRARGFLTYSIYASLAFSEDGKSLAISNTFDGKTTITDTATFQSNNKLAAPADVSGNSSIPTPKVAFARGLYAFASGNDIIVRSGPSKQPLLSYRLKKPSTNPLVSHNPYVLALAFLPKRQLGWVTVDFQYVPSSGSWRLLNPKLCKRTLPERGSSGP